MTGVAAPMTFSKWRKIRCARNARGSAKCRRYDHSFSQVAGFQFCHESAFTQCGSVIRIRPLPLNSGSSAASFGSGAKSQSWSKFRTWVAAPRLAGETESESSPHKTAGSGRVAVPIPQLLMNSLRDTASRTCDWIDCLRIFIGACVRAHNGWHSRRFHDNQNVRPSRPGTPQHDPEEASTRVRRACRHFVSSRRPRFVFNNLQTT